MSTIRSTISVAASAALFALAATAPATQAAAKQHVKEAKVHCYGVNSCKGTSACKTARNECRGQNECKGVGFQELTAKQCAKAGGSLTEKVS